MMAYVSLLVLVVILTTSESCLGQTNRNRQMKMETNRRNSQYIMRSNNNDMKSGEKRRAVPQSIIFPGSVTTTATNFPSTNNNNRKFIKDEIPLALFMKMNNFNTSNDFLENFVQTPPMEGALTSRNKNGVPSSVLRGRTSTSLAAVPFAEPAICTPQATTVPIELTKEPYVLYFPSCTRVDRCGGCCSHELLECAPTKRENVTLQVFKTRYLGPNINKFDVAEPILVSIERHLQCECQCRVKSSDCHAYQVYRPNECRCECLNEDEAIACVGEKFWDSSACFCRCREDKECSTGLYFNRETCMCEMARVSRMGNRPGFRDFSRRK